MKKKKHTLDDSIAEVKAYSEAQREEYIIMDRWNELQGEFKSIPFDIFYRMDREQIINWFKDRTIPK